ncbi:MAG: dihydropteroate synthase [Actinobacteria bacterium]|nr:dihydropteroate synthase [Actinomycetota bacterium]
MIIFGEKINTINKKVADALNDKDALFFRNLTLSQINSGIVDVLDINVGSDVSLEPGNMKWAVNVVEEAVNDKIPLSIDSSYPKTIIAGIESVKNKKGLYVNSITLEESRYKELLPIVKDYGLNVIALPICNEAIPDSSEKRLGNAYKIAEIIKDYGISLSNLYIDCVIEPVSISSKNVLTSLDTVKKVKKNLSEVKTFICLSAVSFGLPDRKLINRNFLTLLMEKDIDAAILDPLDAELVANLYSANLLLDRDENCLNYLNYIRNRII